VNGAALADVALTGGGSVFVVYGKRSSSLVPLGALGSFGYAIDGSALEPSGGILVPGRGGFGAVASAGDVNRDGRADVLVGAPDASHNGRYRSGSAYLFFSA
jgi:hypothetical protein